MPAGIAPPLAPPGEGALEGSPERPGIQRALCRLPFAAEPAMSAPESSERRPSGALAVGASLGPYVIVAPLGAGGMGEVYRARDTKLGREVAIKLLPASFSRKGVGSY